MHGRVASLAATAVGVSTRREMTQTGHRQWRSDMVT